MLKVENISKSWQTFEIRDVSFKVKNKEYFIILGPSGAGKTLLLELIAGIYFPDKGKIFIDREDVTYLPAELRNVAYIPQDYALFPHMTVFDNIAYGLRIRRVDKKEIEKIVGKISEILGISNLLDRKPKTLSGGEKQRVAIARALVTKPKVLLLDEPFASLDIKIRSFLIRKMKEWHKTLKFTAIHVTHSFEEALSLGEKIGVMVNGRLVQVDKAKKIFFNPKNEEVAKFLGFENIFEGVAEGNFVKVGKLKIEIAKKVEGKVRLGIRPEDIIIAKRPFKSSLRNIFEGKVEHIENLGAVSKISVDVKGVKFRAIITRSSLFEMNLNENDKVYLGFKASAIRIFE